MDNQNEVRTETAKLVATFDSKRKKNGFLIELFKTGAKTPVYLSGAFPGAFKGFHLHKIRAARYVCLKGKMKIILFVNGKRVEHILSKTNRKRLYIPANVPTGLLNIGKEEAWLVNYPDPAFDPDLRDEQVDYTLQEVKKLFLKK